MEYWELEQFNIFDESSVDRVTRILLQEGMILIEFFKQPLHSIFNLVEQLVLLSSVRYRYIYRLEVSQVNTFKCWLLKILNNFYIYKDYFYWLYNTKFFDMTFQCLDNPNKTLICLLQDTLFFTDKNLLYDNEINKDEVIDSNLYYQWPWNIDRFKAWDGLKK